MSSQQSLVDYLVEQMADAKNIRSRKMFGEYAIYKDNKVVALVCDDQLFVKPTVAGRQVVGEGHDAPPYPGAKPYLLVTGDRCEDGEWLSNLIEVTAKELPAPKKKL